MQNYPENTNNPENSQASPFLPFQPLRTELVSLPRFPLESLPDTLRNYVLAVSEHTQTPADLPAAIALGVLATALQGKVRVEGNYGHYEQCSLYILGIAAPGERKSAVLSAMTSVLSDYEQAYNERRKPEIRRNRQERESLQRQINRLSRQLEQKYDSMTELELQHLQDNLADLPEIRQARFVADDCTSESLIRLLTENNGRLAIISSEGGVFDNIAGRYSKIPNLDVYLKGSSGDTIRVDRIGRDAEYIRHPALSMVLTVQPRILRDIMENGSMSGRGLLARFLYVNIRSDQPKVFRSAPIREEVSDAYRRLIEQLMDIPADANLTLCLCEDAANRMSDYFSMVERYLMSEGMDVREWGKKLCGMILRIAGLLHMAGGESGEISDETIEKAILIGNFALPHARYAFATIGCDETIEKAMFVMQKLKRRRLACISRADLFQLCRSKFFRKSSEIDPVLEALVNHGYLCRDDPMDSGVGRPPLEMLYIHPQVYSETAG